MNNSSWRSEDGHLLRSLREEAGIDELVFARNNTLSLAQLKELELGGSGCFYNPSIKRNTGVKLLRKLGHELITPEVVIAPVASTEPVVNESTLPTANVMPQALLSTPKAHSESPRQGLIRQPFFWALCLLSLVGLTVIKPWGLLVFPAHDKRFADSGMQAPSSMDRSTPDTAKSASAKQEIATSTVPGKEIAPAPARSELSKPAVKVADSAGTSACDWQHRNNSKIHTPSEPLKPGNYVYLEAQADTELCVLDSQNQKTLLQLKAGMAKSVYGAAPFLIHSQDLQALKLFFQGRRVQEALDDMQYLLLNSQPL